MNKIHYDSFDKVQMNISDYVPERNVPGASL